MRTPNKAGAGNGATMLLLQFERLGRAVPDQQRWDNATLEHNETYETNCNRNTRSTTG